MTPIIVALDVASESQALQLVDQLNPKLCRVKVGKELFTRCGPAILKQLHQRGFEVFLDLKFHDIPNTCAQAVLAAADQGVWMVNVHAGGGYKMMAAAREVLVNKGLSTKLIAVTVLTSMSAQDLQEIGVSRSLEDQVLHLSQLAQAAGLQGVVCSAREAEFLAAHLGQDFLKVTPGIRLPTNEQGDQQRIMTPEAAMQAGSTHLVIGRPITQASDPGEALLEITRLLPQ